MYTKIMRWLSLVWLIDVMCVFVQVLYCQVNCGHFTSGRHRLYHSRRSKSRSCIRTRIKDAILKFHGKNVNVRQVYDRSRRTWKNVDFTHISTHTLTHEYVLEGRQTRQIFKCNNQRVNEILLRTMYSSSTACIAVS